MNRHARSIMRREWARRYAFHIGRARTWRMRAAAHDAAGRERLARVMREASTRNLDTARLAAFMLADMGAACPDETVTA